MISFETPTLGAGDPFTDTTIGLVLGDLGLAGSRAQGDGYSIEVVGDDATWGNPRSVTRVLAGLLADGARVALDRWDNRDAFLRATITGASSAGLEEGEARLFAELGKRSTLTWTPPGGFSTPTVFDVEWSELDHEFDDKDELDCERSYGVRLVCQPFARSETAVVTDEFSAPPAPLASSSAVIDTCSSTAGWEAFPGPITHASGYVYNSTWPNPQPEWTWGNPKRDVRVNLVRTGAVDMTGMFYLVVEWWRERPDWSTIWTPPTLTVDGTSTKTPVWSKVLDKKWTRSVYDLSDFTSLSKMDFETSTTYGNRHRLIIRQIEQVDQIPSGGDPGHQLSRVIPIEGSARTQAAIHVWHTAPLGDVMVHTASTPNGMLSLEPFLTSSSLASAGTVSGSVKNMAAPVTYQVPASTFDPERSTGRIIVARLLREGTGEITSTMRSGHGPAPAFTQVGASQSQTVTPAAMPAQTLVCLGAFTVPPHRVVGEDAVIEVSVDLDGPVGSPLLDDVWLVDVEGGALTWVNSVGKHLWVNAPTTDSPMPSVWESDDVDGRRASAVTPLSMMAHEFPPGDLHLYTVAVGGAGSTVQLEYFPRWHTHAKRLP